MDLEAENQAVDLATVEFIHVRKTGALLLAALRIGAQIAGASAEGLVRISRYGEYLGLAFQIADDILDFQGEDAAGASSESGHNEKRRQPIPPSSVSSRPGSGSPNCCSSVYKNSRHSARAPRRFRLLPGT